MTISMSYSDFFLSLFLHDNYSEHYQLWEICQSNQHIWRKLYSLKILLRYTKQCSWQWKKNHVSPSSFYSYSDLILNLQIYVFVFILCIRAFECESKCGHKQECEFSYEHDNCVITNVNVRKQVYTVYMYGFLLYFILLLIDDDFVHLTQP